MTHKTRALVTWFYIIATAVTFIGILGTCLFEGYVRWFLNQGFAVLDGNGLLGLCVLLGAQMIGLVWLSRSA